MDQGIWSNRVLSLTESLLPLQADLKRDDPITFCLKKRSELMDYITSMTHVKEKKSAQLAREYLKIGTNKFQSKSFKDSLSFYTKSLFYCPKDSLEMFIIYIKRSLVLLYLGYHKDAIHDIEMALLSEFSKKESLQKVMDLLHKGDCKSAVTILYEILKGLEMLPPGWYGEEGFKTQKTVVERSELPTVRNIENADFPSSSNCLKIAYANNKGRYVVAKCDIKVGDVLFVEKAFAFTVRSQYCNNCCQETVAPIPCLNCATTHFCSEKCRYNAWESYHKFECGFISLLEATGLGHLSLRIILKAASNLEELKKITQSLINKKSKSDSHITFSSSQYENLYNLKTHADNMSVEDILQYSLTATLLALYVVHHTTYAPFTDENINLIGKILLHHTTQIGCNAHAISVEKVEDKEMVSGLTFEREEIGGGMYPSVSMMNHSCEPSIVTSFHKDVIIVRACKDIKKGEEVFNSYGVDSRKMERSERQKLLKNFYFFDCNCSSCSQEHDPYDLLNSFKCKECSGPLAPDLKRTTLNNYKKFLICLNCDGLQILQQEHFLTITDIRELMEYGKCKLLEKDFEGALPNFVKAWKMGRRILYKLHMDLLHSAILTAHCLHQMGDLKRCIAFLKCSALSVESRFGSLSSELAFEAKKLSDCTLLYCEEALETESEDAINGLKSMKSLGLRYYDISENIFKLFYGENYPVLSEIQKSKARLRNTM